jgi:hypothetical protein
MTLLLIQLIRLKYVAHLSSTHQKGINTKRRLQLNSQ